MEDTWKRLQARELAKEATQKKLKKAKASEKPLKEEFGSDDLYIHKESDLKAMIKQLEDDNVSRADLVINRFKGLGEMNADQLKLTAMHPDSRTIEKVTIEDAIESEEWLIKLMGDDVLIEKFRSLTLKSFRSQTVDQMIDLLGHVEDVPDIGQFIHLAADIQKSAMHRPKSIASMLRSKRTVSSKPPPSAKRSPNSCASI